MKGRHFSILRPHQLWVTALLLGPILLVLLAAAGANDDAVDPCSLVTKEEAGEALGSPVGEPERPTEANIPPNLATCQYVAKSRQQGGVLTITVRISSDLIESEVGFEATEEFLTEAEDVTGIGDDAFWIGDQLHVRKGKVYLIIGGVAQDKAKTLAQKALGRLK